MDCLFCKIINGEIPTKKLYEDDLVIAFLDAFPNVDGHTLIVPKKHYDSFLDIPEDLIAHIHSVAKKIAPILIDKMGAKAFSLRVNYGETQVIKHFHLHLLPNYDVKKSAEKSVDEIYDILKHEI